MKAKVKVLRTPSRHHDYCKLVEGQVCELDVAIADRLFSEGLIEIISRPEEKKEEPILAVPDEPAIAAPEPAAIRGPEPTRRKSRRSDRE